MASGRRGCEDRGPDNVARGNTALGSGLARSAAVVSAGYEYSTNWAGYVDVGHAYSAVSGMWTVPRVTCRDESYAGFWVGLDGWSNGTVEQDGTAA